MDFLTEQLNPTGKRLSSVFQYILIIQYSTGAASSFNPFWSMNDTSQVFLPQK